MMLYMPKILLHYALGYIYNCKQMTDYLFVVFRTLPGHEDEHQWYLFCVIARANEGINCYQLLERFAHKFESTIKIPRLGFCENHKLFVCSEDEMPSFLDVNFCLEEPLWNAVFHYFEVEVLWILRAKSLP